MKHLILALVFFIACDNELACLHQIQDGSIDVPVGARITFVDATAGKQAGVLIETNEDTNND